MSVRLVERTKTCNGCGVSKPWSGYYAKAKWDDGTMRQPHSRCKLCQHATNAAKARAHRKANPATYKEIDRARYAALAADPIRLADRNERSRKWHEDHRRAQGIPPRRFVPKPVPIGVGPRLDAQPFADYLATVVAQEGTCSMASVRTGVNERVIWGITHGERATVELTLVDATLQRDGSCELRDLYPEWCETGVAA